MSGKIICNIDHLFTRKCVYVQKLESRISITTDVWTSPSQQPFVGVTGHFIDNNWDLKNILLDFFKIEGPHTGENLCSALYKSLEDLDIQNKA